MARGNVAEEGTENVSANGYTYVKQDGRWRPKSHVIIEAKLGRSLTKGETVGFVDGNNKNFDPDNLVLRGGTSKSIHSKIARLISRRDDIEAELEELIDTLPEEEQQDYRELLKNRR